MNESGQDPRTPEFRAVLDELVKRGWATGWAAHDDGRYAIAWTAKGRERCHWLRTINAELDAGERAMTYVMAACCAFGGDEVRDRLE